MILVNPADGHRNLIMNSIARKRTPADPAIVEYLIDRQTDVVADAYVVYEAYGLMITTVELVGGCKIVYEHFDEGGIAYYYNAQGRLSITIED